jgi:uncharacterized protein (DUF1778 family)
MPAETRSDAGLEFRLNRREKSLIEKAARYAGQSVSDFATTTLVQRAQQLVEQRNLRVLTDRDRDIFLAMLDGPPRPNAALHRAAKRFRARRRSVCN